MACVFLTSYGIFLFIFVFFYIYGSNFSDFLLILSTLLNLDAEKVLLKIILISCLSMDFMLMGTGSGTGKDM